jgi:uncharacterized protein YycO
MRKLLTKRRGFAEAEHEAIEAYAPGDRPDDAHPPRPGDFILTHGSGFICWAIRFGQGLWIHGGARQFTYWNHAALVVDSHSGLVEALSGGVKSTSLDKYLDSDYRLVRIKASAEDRQEVVDFGNSCIGEEYGYLTILSIALTLLIRSKITFFIQGDQICSGLVARAQERTHAIFNRNPVSIMPADLAKFYGATR